MKLSQIQYERPDKDEIIAKYNQILSDFDTAKNADEQIQVYQDCIQMQKHLNTMASLAYIRFTLDTRDIFYSNECDFYDEMGPIFEDYGIRFADKMLSSPYREQLEQRLSPLIFLNYEIAKKAFHPNAIEQMQEDNRLCTEYKKLLSSAKIAFRGEELNIPQLGKYKESPDRETRRQAYQAQGQWMKEHAQQFDDIFDKMVHVRDKMAKNCGYENYVQLGYYRMGRNCYSPQDIAAFRQQVLQVWVPFLQQIKAQQAQDLNLDHLKLFDDSIWLQEGNPQPKATVSEMFENGKRMYHEMSSDTGEFIDYMLQHDLFDVLARPGKSGGGYCTELPEYQMPFIFANFNGTYEDVDVLTHEAGHAYASYRAMRSIPLYELTQGGMETCEVHSMSMEFFAWKWMPLFFKENAEKYKYMHIGNALSFIPYGTMVDYFQQLVYEKPDMTPAERKSLWLDLEKQFRPYLSNEGITYMEEGGRWQCQSHIFERPFYYIDYCLAQTVAFEFLIEMHRDYDKAFSCYQQFLNAGGSKTFTQLVQDAGFPSVFSEETLSKMIPQLKQILESLRNNLSSHQ